MTSTGGGGDSAYEIRLDRRAEKRLNRQHGQTLGQLDTDIRSLADNPRPFGVEKLKGNSLRIRSGDWRIIYNIYDGERLVIVTHIRRRNEKTYKGV